MKKLLVLLTAVLMSATIVTATEAISQPTDSSQDIRVKERIQRENAFEKRLGLTEEQKVKARELRLQGHEKMKPVMDEIRAKKNKKLKLLSCQEFLLKCRKKNLQKLILNSKY